MTIFIVMASSICSSTCLSLSSSSSTSTKLAPYCNSSLSVTSQSKNSTFHLKTRFPSLGFSVFSSWNGLKHTGISIAPKLKLERKRRCRNRAVYASLFGVGAPEALVIGVVALLVFGPKGLAEVARNLGKTLRAFQPTIRELQEVSREFKSTLEREIGLDDDIPGSTYRTSTSSSPSSTVGTKDSKVVADPSGASSPSSGYTTEEYLKITEKQLNAASAAQQQRQELTSPSDGQSEVHDLSQASVKETAAGTASTQQPESENEKTG